MPKRLLPHYETLLAAGFVRQSALLAHALPILAATHWRMVRAKPFSPPSNYQPGWQRGESKMFALE